MTIVGFLVVSFWRLVVVCVVVLWKLSSTAIMLLIARILFGKVVCHVFVARTEEQDDVNTSLRCVEQVTSSTAPEHANSAGLSGILKSVPTSLLELKASEDLGNLTGEFARSFD
jgi:hypothetical protein